MDRAKAKSMTRKVQAAAGGLLLLGVAAALAPLSISKADSTEDAPPPAPAPKPPEAPKVEIDTVLLAGALNTVSGPVKNQPVDKPEDHAEPSKPPVTGTDAWRYLGAIMSGTYKRAIIAVGEEEQQQQRLLAEGQTISLDPPGTLPEQRNPANDVEIVQIDRTFIKIKQGEIEKQIDLAPRKRAELTVLDPAAVAARNGAGMNGNGRVNPAPADPAALRRQRDVERFRTAEKMAAEDAAAKEAAMKEASFKESGGKGEKGGK